MNPFCVIPARGGSKRIPRKNIRPFCGKPMLAYSIEAAKASGLFSHIVVSTDDAEIAEVAKRYGAEVPYLRPAELAGDFVNSDEVMAYDTRELCRLFGWPDYACLLYATAPFVRPQDLRRGAKRMVDGAEAAFSVCTFPFPIQRAVRLNTTGQVEMFWPENRYVRSQDLEEAYHDAGQFYWAKIESFLNRTDMWKNAYPIILPRYLVQDIDTLEDWQAAEMLMHRLTGTIQET